LKLVAVDAQGTKSEETIAYNNLADEFEAAALTLKPPSSAVMDVNYFGVG